ncbi:MAG: InlB B-repeat-containing protein [Tannerella sp.]|jgi:uncharacterized repeat protein (TIGR02543 family)/uncharacterized repeat protein (TIGR01451 family)|nr:InlB B-repeat-containing protein [Tannerella sp.]
MRKKLLLLCVSLLCGTGMFTQAAISVDLGAYTVTPPNQYAFPNATVTGNPGDLGYVVRVMFTRAVTSLDVISLPSLPSGFSEHASSNQHVRVINGVSGANPADLQTFLRGITVSVDPGKLGHGIMVLISDNIGDANRAVYYSSETDNWYELINNNGGSITWLNAYNAALDREFMSKKGYLVTVTSPEENAFLSTMVQANTWTAGTRWNISPYLDPISGKITTMPNTTTDLLEYWYWSAGPEWEDNGKNSTQSVFYNKRIASQVTPTPSITVKYPYTNWAGGEPNNSGTEYCAHLYGANSAANRGLWNDYNNNTSVSYYLVEYTGIKAGASTLVGFESSKNASNNGVAGNGASASHVPVDYTDVLTYTIAAVNAADKNNTVVVVDTLPAGLEYVAGSATAGAVVSSTVAAPVRTILTWNLSVNPQGQMNVSFQAKKVAGATNQMVNTATVTSNGGLVVDQTNATYHEGRVATVTFATGTGGTISNGTQQSVDYTLNAVAGVTYTPALGYEFTGWNYPSYVSFKGVNQTANTVPDYTTVSILGNVTFTANFRAIDYNLTYDPVGGTDMNTPNTSGNPATYNVTQLPLTINNLTKTGYDFAGWTSAAVLVVPSPTTGLQIPANTTGDIHFTANWTKQIYAITYNGNGATIPSSNPTAYDIESATITLENPTRAGYTFLGWTGSNGSTPQTAVTIPTGSTGDKTYTANWSTDIYTITYDYDNGTAPATANPGTYTIEQTLVSISNQPTRTGYTFTGWTGTDVSTPATTVTIPAGATGNRAYKANWSKITYNITYDGNGGTLDASNPATYDVESPPIILVAPTRTGYTFTGWTGTNGSTPTTNVTIPTGSTGNRTYTANWSAITYNITYNLNSGTAPATANPATYTIEDTPFSFSSQPTRSGFLFEGWTGPNGSTPQTTVAVPAGTTGDLTYDANWSENDYLISYDYDGGTAPATANKSGYKITETPFTISNPPTRAGYTFTGWTGSNGSTPQTSINVASGTTGNLSYKANWSTIGYTITYNGNGGTTPAANPVAYNKETPTITLEPSVRPGYTFGGWQITSDEAAVTVATGVTVPTGTYGNLTCEALWTIDSYTITYDNNGGIDNPIPNPVTYVITDLPVMLNPPSRVGYAFDKWTITSDTTGVTIPDGDEIVAGTYGNLTCVAQWIKLYSVTYSRSLGTSGVEPVDNTWYNLNDPVTVMGNVGAPQMALLDATFMGWSFVPQSAVITAAPGIPGDLILPAAMFNIVADTVLYAVWGEDKTGPGGTPDDVPDFNQFKVLYDGNSNTGGYVPVDINNYNAGNPVTVIGNIGLLTVTDATFIGWSETQHAVIMNAASIPADLTPGGAVFNITADKTFYAVWANDESGPNGVPDNIPDYLQFPVIYDGNGNTGGTVPVDINLYNSGDNVSISGNTGTLVRINATFIGWSFGSHAVVTTEPAIPSDLVQGGSSFPITAPATLYAVWAEDNNGPDGVPDDIPDYLQIRLIYNENSSFLSDGGALPAPGVTMITKNTSVVVKGNTDGLYRDPDDQLVFAGWSQTDGRSLVDVAADKPADMLMAGDALPTGTTDIYLYVVWAFDRNGNGVPDYNEPSVTTDPQHEWPKNDNPGDPSDPGYFPEKPVWNPENDLPGANSMYAGCGMNFVVTVDPDPFRDRTFTLNYLGALMKEFIVGEDGEPLADSYTIPKGQSTFTLYFTLDSVDREIEGKKGALEAVIAGGGRDTSAWFALYNHPSFEDVNISQYVDMTGRINLGITGGSPFLMRSINGLPWVNAFSPLTATEKISVTDGASIWLREPGGCGEYRLQFIDYNDPDVQRYVDLTALPQDVTVNYIRVNGEQAVHNIGRNYVKGHEDFEFNATYAGGKPYVVQAYGDYSKETVRLYPTLVEDGSYNYIIRQVVEPWTVTFITTEIESMITGTESVTGIQLWTHNDVLNIRSGKSATVAIYTMDGRLYRSLAVTEGLTREVLPRGIYVVVIDSRRFKVVSR